jgi:hypothetical protein
MEAAGIIGGGVLKWVVVLLCVSLKREASRKSLWCASLSSSSWHSAWHAATKAVETPASTSPHSTASHLGSKHLHQDLGVDTHSSSHPTSTKTFHWIDKIFTTIVSSTLPVLYLVRNQGGWGMKNLLRIA